jgi:hypothetical protein
MPDLQHLAQWFYRHGGSASMEVMQDDGIQVYTLARHGLIQPEAVGRWGVRYTPAGALRDVYLRFKSDTENCPSAETEFLALL